MTDPQTPLEQLQAQWRAKAEQLRASATGDPWEAGEHHALIACADALSPIIEQQKKADQSRVDGERRAAGPTGSTASGIWAVRSLLQKVPDDMPRPEVIVEEDGMIGFDWHHTVHCCIGMHVDDNGHAGWAALIGDYRSHGHFSLDLWPEELNEAFRKFMERAR